MTPPYDQRSEDPAGYWQSLAFMAGLASIAGFVGGVATSHPAAWLVGIVAGIAAVVLWRKSARA